MIAKHLQPNILDGEPAREHIRLGFGEGLKEAGEQDPRVVALCADLTGSTKVSLFAEAFPERFIQVGVAEQNMASVASGLAAMGKVPFAASYAMFNCGRNWEQIRTTIGYNESNVKIVGAHSGVSVGPDGATHQAIEDIALMRVIPGMVVLAPADVHEAKRAVLAAAAYEGPVYIRLVRESSPIVTTVGSPFEIGKAERVFSRDETHATKVGIVVTGTLLYNALKAADELQKNGIGVSVLHMPTIKPLDAEALEQFAAEHDALVTVEEHQVAGGLGSAVSEHLCEKGPIRIVKVGVHDQFGQSGEPQELIAHYGMDVAAIRKAVERVLV